MCWALWKLLPYMHLVWCLCLMPLKWPFCRHIYKLPPGFCLCMEISRDPLGFIMNAVLLFHPLFKLCLGIEPMHPFNLHACKHIHVLPMNRMAYSHPSKFYHLQLFDQSSKSKTAVCYTTQSVLIQVPGWPHEGLVGWAVGGLDLLDMLDGLSCMHCMPHCKPMHAHAHFSLHCEWHSKLRSSSPVIWPVWPVCRR